jgi:hypothetical protein
MDVDKGIPFNVMGRVWSTLDGEGTLTLSIKYGSRPDFRASPGMLLLEYAPLLAQTPFDWVITTDIPEPAFSDNATIQIEYSTGPRPENWTEPFMDAGSTVQRPWSSVFQCIDLTVKGSKPRPPGAGESYDPSDYMEPTGPGGRGVDTTNPEQSSGLSPLYIGLIIAAIVIALCLILLLVCCLCRKKKPPPETLLDEKVENVKAHPVPPPTSPPEGPVVRVHFEEGEQPPPTPVEVKTPQEEEGPKDGSFGRLFHFKYVEGDEEHGEEDLKKLQQQRTLEKPRTLEREFDQASKD